MKYQILSGLGVAGLGCILLTVAWFTGKEAWGFWGDSYEVQAVVVSVKQKSEIDRRERVAHHETTYSPSVRFVLDTGEAFEAQASWYSDHHYRPGESVSLVVEKSDPTSFVENRTGSVWGTAALFALCGAGFLIWGVFLLVRRHSE